MYIFVTIGKAYLAVAWYISSACNPMVFIFGTSSAILPIEAIAFRKAGVCSHIVGVTEAIFMGLIPAVNLSISCLCSIIGAVISSSSRLVSSRDSI